MAGRKAGYPGVDMGGYAWIVEGSMATPAYAVVQSSVGSAVNGARWSKVRWRPDGGVGGVFRAKTREAGCLI